MVMLRPITDHVTSDDNESASEDPVAQASKSPIRNGVFKFVTFLIG
jgi:hypothetical protein